MRRNYTKIGPGIAAITITALAAVPSTGWVVRQQFRELAGRSAPGLEAAGTGAWTALTANEQAVAEENPTDYPTQLAWALRRQEVRQFAWDQHDVDEIVARDRSAPFISQRLRAILPLRERFAGKPEMQADLLRALCSGDFRIGRTEEDILLPPKEAKPPTATVDKLVRARERAHASRAAIDLTVDAASRGESLDPQNAFFPTLLAAALLADHKDTEAFEALSRAADKPLWNDYAGDEGRARIALLTAANKAEPGSIARVSIAASILLPHFSLLRDEARVVTALAVQHELGGDREGGFAIRRSMARVGATMRAQPQSLICALVGASITSITAARPGGLAALASRITPNNDARSAAFESRYVAYLSEIGHADEAGWFVAERSARDKVRQVGKVSGDSPDDFMRPYVVLSACWVVCLYMLTSIIMMIAIGGASVFFARSKRVKSDLPLHRGVRIGLLAMAQVPFLFVFGKFLYGDSGNAFALVDAAAFLLLLFFLKRKQTTRAFLNELRVVFTTIVSALAVLAVANWFGDRVGKPLGILYGLNGSENTLTSPISQAGFVVAALSAPTICIIGLAFRSRLRRTPASVGIVRGLAKIAVPAAVVLLLSYIAAVGVTLYQETLARNEVTHELTDEGSYLASKIGIDWPGAVHISTPLTPESK